MPLDIFQLGSLFHDVQTQRIFPDGKTFADCIPLRDPAAIIADYEAAKADASFKLEQFVLDNFALPKAFAAGDMPLQQLPVEQHIHQLWAALTRQPDEAGGSLLPLPHPYVVPGGRFGEVYYWDSYFTMLGLKESGEFALIEHMVNNFTHLVNTVGYIPNGNRTYYLGRSQPPFYSLMVELLAGIKGEQVYVQYLPALEKEYAFWMKGAAELDEHCAAAAHVVRMKGGELLNRYWDEQDSPRPESYREDVELAHAADRPESESFRHLRAGAESGWDYSSRWLQDGQTFVTIHTTNIVPVDLNCLLYQLELCLSTAQQQAGNEVSSLHYQQLAEKRKAAIQRYCWNERLLLFTDVAIATGEPLPVPSLAAMFPLFMQLATPEQAASAAGIMAREFLKDGGLVTTLCTTGQQWDAPNGWAPLQWIAIIGLRLYGFEELAATIARRWIQLNTDVYNRTGKLMEKYNVVNTQLEAGGGEYAGQDGFGWTNGVLLALLRLYPPTGSAAPQAAGE